MLQLNSRAHQIKGASEAKGSLAIATQWQKTSK